MYKNNLHREGLVAHVMIFSACAHLVTISRKALRTDRSILLFSFVVFDRFVPVDQPRKPNKKDSIRLEEKK